MSESLANPRSLSHQEAVRAFSDQSLFENKTWRYSPEAFPLSSAQIKQIEQIGQACYEFYKAQETLYLRSAEGKNLLRNRPLKAPWVAAYLDRGKPEALIQHARAKALRGAIPVVIRPDLLLTEDGFAMTEIDSVPGGIGLTAFLNRLYAEVHGDSLVGSGSQDMIDAFYTVLAQRAPNQQAPYIAILVSDEAATYRPEMEWLASQLRQLGKRVLEVRGRLRQTRGGVAWRRRVDELARQDRRAGTITGIVEVAPQDCPARHRKAACVGAALIEWKAADRDGRTPVDE